MIDRLDRLGEAVVHMKGREFVVGCPGNVPPEKFQKMVEVTLWGTERKATIYSSGRRVRGNNAKPISGDAAGRQRIIVSTNGKDFASVLKDMKKAVDVDSADITIRSVKKTSNGDVMVEVRGGVNKANQLKDAIVKGCSGTEVFIKAEEVLLHRLDIEADMDAGDIASAVARECETPLDGVRVTSTSEVSPQGQRRATVLVPKAVAAKLTQQGHIRIGWSRCRVRQRTETGIGIY